MKFIRWIKKVQTLLLERNQATSCQNLSYFYFKMATYKLKC